MAFVGSMRCASLMAPTVSPGQLLAAEADEWKPRRSRDASSALFSWDFDMMKKGRRVQPGQPGDDGR